MHETRIRGLVLALAAALLLVLAPLAPVGALSAQLLPTSDSSKQTTLTGKLSQDDLGGYVLIEAQSGDSVSLVGLATELSSHVGETVRVTGRWTSDSSGGKTFTVTRIEKA